MIKRFALKRISIYTLCLILITMFYFLPSNETISQEIAIRPNNEMIVYLLDNDNYLSSVISYYDEKSIEDLMIKKIDILINGNEELNDFKTLIPKGTKIKSLKVDKNNVYINFSKEFLTIGEETEEKMIEAIIFSLTEVNGIDNIYISVEGEKLLSLPSGKEVDYPLTREYGINKEYNLNSLFNINKTVVYFIKDNYYVPVTKINNDNESQIEVIIKELKSSVNSQNNLGSNINDNLILKNYKIEKDNIIITFNKEVSSNSKELINKSIKENYNINNIEYRVKK